MGKILFGLIGVCCLSGFLIANPEKESTRLSQVTEKEVMSFCAIKFLQDNPFNSLTIDNLTFDKPKLVRQASDAALNFMNFSLGEFEKALVKIIVSEYCPVPTSPKPTGKKCCPVPSPKKKQRKSFPIPSTVVTPIQAYTHHDESDDDCGVPATTPPPSPVVTTRAIQHVDRLHRQWTTKWKSDGDLQALLNNSSSSSSSRKRATSDSKI